MISKTSVPISEASNLPLPTKINVDVSTEKVDVNAKAKYIEKKIKEMSLTKEELEKLQIEKERELIIPFFWPKIRGVQ
ncbi:hypothetical protein L3Y34_016226 [Caenorhabditis briggsae]|uniref:Uncharacterized protein n=1 Tax=Caenorhabditis briggsae TaxID=6238 RepID=A0AAE9DYR6_CAEBR|nr:hypothetical protein L3Y34_016226 [Caenorhabditis briggsae]